MPGSLFTLPRQTALGTNARALPGARLTIYRAGTSILTNVFANAELTAERTNPVVASSSGRFPAIYLDNATGYAYRVVLTTADGALVWDEDNVPASAVGEGGGGGAGTDGAPGLSVAELVIYRRSDTVPTTPAGGAFSFLTQTLTPPEGWSSDIPTGSAPVYASRAVAASETPTGTDGVLEWSSPVRVLSDGASVDIIFRRAETQPATPNPSPGVPVGWYTDVGSVPAGAGVLWSSVGTRPHAGFDWIWQLPVQVEGSPGAPGQDGEDGAPGAPGVDGDGISVEITTPAVSLVAYTNGNVLSYAPAVGKLTVYNSGEDVTQFATLTATPINCTGTINAADSDPVQGQLVGYYQVTNLPPNVSAASLVLTAVYNGQTYTKVFSVSKSYVGYEIVSSLPNTNLFPGRMVFLLSDGKLYRYHADAWTTAVPAIDIVGELQSAQIASLAAAKITGQLSDTQIAALSAAKLTGQIISTQITDGAISTPKLAAGAVTTERLAANAVTASNIAANAVIAAKIEAGAVTAGKIAAGAVQAGNIAANAVTAGTIAANAVTAGTIEANAVTADSIAAGQITSAKINTTEFSTVGLSAITSNIGTMTAGVLQSGATESASKVKFDLANSRIVYDSAPGTTGGVVRVSGAGFGPSSQYLEWFGPKPAGQTTHAGIIANLTDAAAIQYLKTNGSAYFGGSLSTGLLKNAITGTLITANAETILGPFGTNGGSKTVSYSYSFLHGDSWNDPSGNFSPDYTQSATLVLERRIAGGAWTQIGGPHTVTMNVNYEASPSPGEPGGYEVYGDSAWTLTDTNASTGNFEYRLRLTARDTVVFMTGTTSQAQTIVSTE